MDEKEYLNQRIEELSMRIRELLRLIETARNFLKSGVTNDVVLNKMVATMLDGNSPQEVVVYIQNLIGDLMNRED